MRVLLSCSKHVQSPDGLCPLGTTAEPNQRGQCLTDTSLHGKTPSTQTSNSGGSGTTTNTGTGGTTSTPMMAPLKAGGGTTTGPGTTTTTTSAKTTTTTTTPKQTGTTTSGSTGTPTSTAKATTTKIINNNNVIRGSSGGGTSAATPHTQTTTNNNFLTYANTINKITIKYPSTWTKTEFTGNPSIPVIFNTPTTITTATGNTGLAAAAKNSFVISITPSASNLDNFTQQRLNALTHSNGVKYSITNTTAKVLTPPTGVTAYREVSYDATKNIIVNNTIPTQVPLKGAAIFFVNSGTGYSLLYLAKQTEYTQNLPMIQQMVNSFRIGNGGGTAASSNSTR